MVSRPPPDFSALIERLARALQNGHVPFMLIGGQAVLLHGEPRLTQDIDITLGVGPDRMGEVVELCEESGLDVLPDDVEDFVRSTFVLPVRHLESNIRVDLIFSTTPYEEQAIARAVNVKVGDTNVPFATAEDLIVHKLFAGRPRDLEDAVGVVRRKSGELDWGYMSHWLDQFAEIPGRENVRDRLKELRAGE